MARLAFLGTPEPAAYCLSALVEAGHEVALVITEPDKRRGRGRDTSATPTKVVADRFGLPVSHVVADCTGIGAEIGVVVAFGRLIQPAVLEQLPMINLHFSLLPRWRGAAPVERAILAGDEVTGVCLMRLEEGLDTGPVYAREVVAIGGDDASALRNRLTYSGARMLVDHLADGLASLGDAEPQAGEVTYAAKITPEDVHIGWASAANEIGRLVRVGRAWSTWRGDRFLVWSAEVAESPPAAFHKAAAMPPGTIGPGGVVVTGDGFLRLTAVQQEGRKRQDAGSWLQGARIAAGEAFV
jgi:methionyl-tRNA formyltransferase